MLPPESDEFVSGHSSEHEMTLTLHEHPFAAYC
jgi:hypothetical protein